MAQAPREAVLSLPTAQALADYVHGELCRFDTLDPAQTPLRQTPLTRRGKPAAVLFHVHGPRQLRASAVWSIDDGRLLFYDSTGSRARSVRLSESPEKVGDRPPAPPKLAGSRGGPVLTDSRPAL